MNLRRRLSDRAWTGFSALAVLIAILPLASIIYFVAANGIARVSWSFLTSASPIPGASGGGIADALQGSAIIVALGCLLGIPVGVMSGIYVSEYSGGRYGQTIRFLADVLAGVPSIVTGIFVYALLVLTLGTFSVLAGAFALGIMMIPIVTNTTLEALKLVPNSIREASMALGVRKWRTILLALASAKGGVATGFLLAIARIMGETAPLLLTVLGVPAFFSGLLHPANALTLAVFNGATSGDPTLVSLAYGASFVLLMVVLAINIGVRTVTRRKFQHV